MRSLLRGVEWPSKPEGRIEIDGSGLLRVDWLSPTLFPAILKLATRLCKRVPCIHSWLIRVSSYTSMKVLSWLFSWYNYLVVSLWVVQRL